MLRRFFVISLMAGVCALPSIAGERLSVSSNDVDGWSFTVKAGELECINQAVVFHANGKTYSVNGKAMSRYAGKFPEWREIAKPYPGLESVSNAKLPPPPALTKMGLSLCK